MKKKISVILILIVLSAAFFTLPTYSYAETAEAQEKNIHLVNPSSLAIDQSFLYVADNVTENESVVHTFGISASKPFYVSSEEFKGNINGLVSDGNVLYILFKDKVTAVGKDERKDFPIAAKDLTVVEGIIYYITANAIYEKKESGTDKKIGDLADATACCGIGDTLYFLYGNYYRCYTDDAGYVGEPKLLTKRPAEIINIDGEAAFVYSSNIVSASGKLLIESEEGAEITDAAYESGNGLYVLNKANKVIKFSNNGGNFIPVADYEIGSDEVNYSVPALSDVTSFTLAKAVGYPANIVYKTCEKSTSIPALIDKLGEKTFIILGYDKDVESDYYYVFVDDAFGWIKKSGEDGRPESDLKIQINSTALDSVSSFDAKLMTANAAYVYYLPASVKAQHDFLKDTVFQTADAPTTVTLLQKFAASDGAGWYFVAYDGKYGFVAAADVGRIYSTGPKEEIVLEGGQKKINASLSDSVSVFLTESMEDGEATVDPETGKKLKLETGTIVNVIKNGKNAAYVQIVSGDGKLYYGYVSQEFLIGVNALTNNSIVGLSILGGAVVLGAAFAVIIVKRKQRLKKNAEIVIEE